VSDRVFTMAELKNQSMGGDLILNTVRDQLKIRIMEHDKRKRCSARSSTQFCPLFSLIRYTQTFFYIPIRFS
jgi:hypothetical protein